MAITDLTDYTWTCTSTNTTAGYGIFNVIASEVDGEEVHQDSFTSLCLGYDWDDDIVATANSVIYMGMLHKVRVGTTIKFAGGTDVTNPQLISWLEANGTLQGGEPEQTDTKPIYKRVNGAWVKLTAFERVNGAWVKISSADGGTEEPEQPQEPENCLTFSSPSTFTLGVVDNTKYWDGTLEYSTDGSTWSTWVGTSAISSASDGTKHNLYLRGTGNTYITGTNAKNTSYSKMGYWKLNGSNISCIGNIENLLDYATVANGGHPTMAKECYKYMFESCTSLVTAPELPATTLTIGCYYQMFRNCTGLTTAPELPATTLADSCCYYMFGYCTSLTTLPALPVTTLTSGCYYMMFYGCTKIKISATQTGEYQTTYRVPTTGTGTTGINSLYSMFGSTGGTFTSTPTINTTYYTSNTVV